MNYYATGEGVTSFVAVGGSPEASEAAIKEKLDEYFHRGIITAPINTAAKADVRR